MPTDDEILAAGAAAAEKFVTDSAAMDEAFRTGKFDEWLKAYVAEFMGDVNSRRTDSQTK